jgi:uncharacterized protein YcaQ
MAFTHSAGKSHELTVSIRAARRFLIWRTGLGRLPGEKPAWAGTAGVTAAVGRLEYVQVDPMQVLACNHDLALAARVEGYQPEMLDNALYRDRSLVEVIGRNRIIVPAGDYDVFRIRFAENERSHRPQLASLEPVMDKVLRRIEAEGPLSSLDFDDDTRISGWWEPDDQSRTRAVRQALEWLWHFGRVAISHRTGQRRHFDLSERLFGPAAALPPYKPSEPAGVGTDDAQLRDKLLRKYYRAMGLVDARDWSFGWTKYTAPEKKALISLSVEAGELVPVRVEGIMTTYYVTAAETEEFRQAGDRELDPVLSFLPPLDNLTWLRSRLSDFFGFDYTWEAYVPKDKRRYGPYTCPILRGDTFVGRIDAHLDRERSVLQLDRVWWEPGAEAVSADEMDAALHAWARANGVAAAGDPSPALLNAAIRARPTTP